MARLAATQVNSSIEKGGGEASSALRASTSILHALLLEVAVMCSHVIQPLSDSLMTCCQAHWFVSCIEVNRPVYKPSLLGKTGVLYLSIYWKKHYELFLDRRATADLSICSYKPCYRRCYRPGQDSQRITKKNPESWKFTIHTVFDTYSEIPWFGGLFLSSL